MNICILPARGGSKRIPRKNIRLFHGKPILTYSIEIARSSGLFDKIIVSTEDEGVRAVAKAYQAKIHNRAASLADDITGTQAVVRSALQWWVGCRTRTLPEFVCCIYATSPLMTCTDLRAGLEALLRQKEAQYVYPVGPDMVDAGQWYWGSGTSFIDGVPLTGNSILHRLPPERVCDINTEEDWQRAEALYQEMQDRRIHAQATQ